jgi:hypothetical protein
MKYNWQSQFPFTYIAKFESAKTHEEVSVLWREIAPSVKDPALARLFEEVRWEARERVNISA